MPRERPNRAVIQIKVMHSSTGTRIKPSTNPTALYMMLLSPHSLDTYAVRVPKSGPTLTDRNGWIPVAGSYRGKESRLQFKATRQVVNFSMQLQTIIIIINV